MKATSKKINGAMHTLGWALLSGIIVLGIVPLGIAWYYQEQLIFCPDVDRFIGPIEPGYASPSDWRLPVEDIWTVSPNTGEKNHAWLMKQSSNSASCPTIVFFHGNAGTINRRLPFYHLLFSTLGVNVVASSYRGYEQSTGTPGEAAFSEDAELLLKSLASRDDLDTSKFIVFGRSIGGAVAVDVALKCPEKIRAVIVENTFSSLSDVAKAVYAPLAYVTFLNALIRHKFDTASKIPRVPQSIMFISGDSDELVPPAQMRYLREHARAARSRTWLLVGQGTHNDTWVVHQRAYIEALRAFIQRIMENVDKKDVDIEIGSPKYVDSGEGNPSFMTRLSTIFKAEPSMDKKEL